MQIIQIFPEIDYSYWSQCWYDTIGQQKGYSCEPMNKFINYNGSLLEIENKIEELVVQDSLEDEKILHVVDLIYRWGGKQSRLFYSRKDKITQLSFRDLLVNNLGTYKEAVENAKIGNPDSERMFRNVKGIGVSYSGKHAHFWSRGKPQNTLIIIDQKIAGMLGFKTVQALYHNFTYKKLVQDFATKSFVEFREYIPHKVEKALFAFHNHYFLNNNSGWKNKKEFIDYKEAKKLSEILFTKN